METQSRQESYTWERNEVKVEACIMDRQVELLELSYQGQVYTSNGGRLFAEDMNGLKQDWFARINIHELAHSRFRAKTSNRTVVAAVRKAFANVIATPPVDKNDTPESFEAMISEKKEYRDFMQFAKAAITTMLPDSSFRAVCHHIYTQTQEHDFQISHFKNGTLYGHINVSPLEDLLRRAAKGLHVTLIQPWAWKIVSEGLGKRNFAALVKLGQTVAWDEDGAFSNREVLQARRSFLEHASLYGIDPTMEITTL